VVAGGDCAVGSRIDRRRAECAVEALREYRVPIVLLRRFADAAEAMVFDGGLRESA